MAYCLSNHRYLFTFLSFYLNPFDLKIMQFLEPTNHPPVHIGIEMFM